MKASFIQKCSFALALAVVPFLAGCDQDRAGAATASDATTQIAQAQPAAVPPVVDASVTDTNVVDDNSVATNEDANLENAEGKLISTPATAGTNVITNPQLTGFVKLVQAGVGESVLLAYVTNSPSAFNVSSDDILYLNDLGAPETVISAMLQKDQQYGAGGVAGPATPPTTSDPMATAAAQTPMPGGPGEPPPTMDANAMVQTPPLTPSADVEAAVEQAPNASYSYFYDSLSPYGNWVNINGYGPCWQPTVVVANPGWTPYGDRGHWAYTDSGWCWVSDYSWGWAPFHYGRWFRNSHYGWCWAPDTVWGPAWVSWRYSDAYCGWAPLPPSACYRPGFGFSYYGRSVGFGFTFGLGASRFTFVSLNRFCDRNPARFRVQHREVTKIYNTTVINNQIIRGRNNTLINRGIPVNRVAAATHTDIHPIRIQANANGPRSPQLGRDGRSLSVYRPALPTPKTTVAPRLVGEGVKPAPQFNIRSRVERNQVQNQAPRPQVDRNPGMNNTPGSRPIIGSPNANRPADNNVARDNRGNGDNRVSQPGAQNPNSIIMRGPNRVDRQNNSPVRDGNTAQTPPNTPGRGQQFQPAVPNQNQPDRSGNNGRTVIPPFTPNQNDTARQNQQNLPQPTANRSIELQQQQQQMQQQRQVEQQQRQDQRQQLQQQQQQQRILQQQQRDVQQQQQRDVQPRQFQPPVAPTPRQDAPANPTFRAESPRMQESRPAPAQEFRAAPPQQQFSAPISRQDSGGGGGSRNNGGGNGGSGGGGGGGGRGGGGNGNGGGRGR